MWREYLGTSFWFSHQLDECFIRWLCSDCPQEIRNKGMEVMLVQMWVCMGWPVSPLRKVLVASIGDSRHQTGREGNLEPSKWLTGSLLLCTTNGDMRILQSPGYSPCLGPCSVGINDFLCSQSVSSWSCNLMEEFRGSSDHVHSEPVIPSNQRTLLPQCFYLLRRKKGHSSYLSGLWVLGHKVL